MAAVGDQELLERWIRSRDAEAFEALVQGYLRMVYGTCRRRLGNAADAEDIAQECFQALATRPRPPRGPLGPWLHRVAVNLSLTHARGEGRRRRREQAYAEAAPKTTEPGWDDIYALVDEALDGLPARVRGPVVAHFLEGKTHARIAEEAGLPRQTVTNRIQRGLALLQRALARKGVTAPAAALGTALSASSEAEAPASLTVSLGKLALSGECITTAGPLAAGLTLGGAFVMKKLMILTAALVLVAAGGWITLNSEGDRHHGIAAPDAAPRAAAGQPGTGDAGVPMPDSGEAGGMLGEMEPTAAEPAEPAPDSKGDMGPKVNERFGAITGRVYDAATGEGVAGCVVTAERVTDGGAVTHEGAPSDASGNYSIEGLPAAGYALKRNAPWGYRRETWGPGSRRRVEVAAGRIQEGIDFAIRREAPLSGTVVDPQGNPVGGAEVGLGGGQDFYVGDTRTTGEDGKFAFQGLRPTGDLWLAARLGETMKSERMAIVLPEEGMTGLVLTLRPAMAITGVVVNPEGEPQPNILVIASGVAGGRKGGYSQNVTDGEGRFAVEGLDPGAYRMRMRENAGIYYQSASDETPVVTLQAGVPPEELRLVYAGANAISGRVTNETGQPVPGLRLFAGSGYTFIDNSGKTAKTDDDGRYVIPNTGTGSYDVEVQPTGTYEQAMRHGIQGTRDDVDFVVKKRVMRVVRGRVLDRDTGQAITVFEQAADYLRFGELESGTEREFQAVQDPEGRFQVLLHPYMSAVFVRAKGYATAWQELEFPPGQHELDVVFRLEPGGDLHGKVVDTSGNPVADAQVYLGKTMYYGERFSTLTNPRGEFVLPSFPKSEQRVSVAHEAYAHATQVIPARANLESPFTFTLTKGGRLEGTFTLADGTAPGDVLVSIIATTQAGSSSAQLDPSGRFTFAALAEGDVELQVSARGGMGGLSRSCTRQVAIRARQTSQLDIVLPAGDAAVSGGVTGVSASALAPNSYAPVSLTQTTPDGENVWRVKAEPDAAGFTYTLAGIPSGPATLAFRMHNADGQLVEVDAPVNLSPGDNRLDLDAAPGR